jgi:type II secretory pathway pseudopilin PulG
MTAVAPILRPRGCAGLVPRRFDGFTLIEAVVSMSLMAICGGALLVGVSSSLETTQNALEQAVAQGIAEQLVDEIVGRRYSAAGAGPYEPFIGPSPTEAATPGRRYTDIDDFNGFRAQPPVDMYGLALGQDDGVGGTRHANFRAPSTFFSRWREEIDVYYVSNTNPSQKLASGQTSDYRAIEVRIILNDPTSGVRPLANARRVVAYVPSP